MRRLIIALSFTVAAPAAAEDLDLPDYDAVRTPASPGFTLLKLSPSQIERPSSPKAFAIAIGGAIKDGGSIEVAPYWLVSHPDTTFEEYRGRGMLTQLKQNLSFSLASVPGDGMSPDTTLALGVRSSASLSRGHIAACDAELDVVTQLASADADRVATERGVDKLPIDQQAAAILKIKQEIVDAQQLAPERKERCLVDGGINARGFAVELAAATSIVFTASDLNDGREGKSAAWLTLAYRWEHATVAATVRGRREVEGDVTTYPIEPGARFIATGGRIAASAELIGRIDDESTYRVAAVAEVRVADDSWLSLSFGRDFGAGGDDGPLFTLASLEWGYGDPRVGGR